MLNLSRKQTETFRGDMQESFRTRCDEFLRTNFAEWYAQRSAKDIEHFIKEMIDFAGAAGIKAGVNIQKLMHYKITPGFDTPLSSVLRGRLTEAGLREYERVENFRLALVSGLASRKPFVL